MATNPLFVADVTTLKRELRLSGVPANSDVEAQIAQALMEARVWLVDRLSASRVAIIQATAYTENPTTTEQYTRAKARMTEILMCRLKLLRKLPAVFRESNSGALQEWNEGGLDRDMSSKERSLEIARLETDIEEALIALAAGAEDNQTTRAAVIGPPCRNPAPGSAVFA